MSPGSDIKVTRIERPLDIWTGGVPTHFTEEMNEAIFFELPNGMGVMGGGRESSRLGNGAEFSYAWGLFGNGVVRIEMHGGVWKGGIVHISTPQVSYNGEPTAPKTPWLTAECPPDWPARGNNPDAYEKLEHKNFARMSQWLTWKNPIALVASHCNGDQKLGGLSPVFWRRMILLPEHECRLQFVVMPRPGFYSYGKSQPYPLSVAKESEYPGDPPLSALVVFRKTMPLKGRERWWEEVGPYVSDMRLTQGLENEQRLPRTGLYFNLERLEVEQFGKYHNQFLAAIFRSGDRHLIGNIFRTRYTLREAYWSNIKNDDKDPYGPQHALPFADRIEKGEITLFHENAQEIQRLFVSFGPSVYESPNGRGRQCPAMGVIRVDENSRGPQMVKTLQTGSTLREQQSALRPYSIVEKGRRVALRAIRWGKELLRRR